MKNSRKKQGIAWKHAAAALLLMPAALAVDSSSAHAGQASGVPHAGETRAQRDARMHWWRDARFGMFIHWGLYSQFAGNYNGKPVSGYGEWIMRNGNIPVATYATQARNFDPEQFNATRWVAIAKAAGMKYIVMTAKHHEGFAMYPTKVDDFNIDAHTRFKHDPIGEMAAACKKAGIKFGVYYSQNLDWHHPGGGTAGTAWDPAQAGSYDAYFKKVCAPQIKELITWYHPAVLWFDIPGQLTPEEVRGMTASFPHDPGLIINNRMGGGVQGDYQTPEQRIPSNGFPGQDWETCMTINDTWGYKSADTNFKSTTVLLRNLIDIASKGGNYLLNVGPSPQGVIPDQEVLRLKKIGSWMKVNGQSVYGTKPSPWKKLPFDGRATVQGNRLYLNVLTWPSSGAALTGLETRVLRANVVATGQALSVTKGKDGSLVIGRPAHLDPISTAVVLTLAAPPVVVDESGLIERQANGDFDLKATDADLSKGAAQVEGNPGQEDIGFWTHLADTAEWTITVPASGAGRYRVDLNYSCDPLIAGSTFDIDIDGAATGAHGTVARTTGWSDYKDSVLANTVFLKAGRHILSVKPIKITYAVMNLRRITLSPVQK